MSIHPQVHEPLTPRREYETEVTDNLENLFSVLPPRVTEAMRALLAEKPDLALMEIVLDLGRKPEVRVPEGAMELLEIDVTRDDLQYVAERVGTFGDDNRAGIERTLHRISAIRNRTGEIVGLTCRIGRAVYGTIAIIGDLIESGESILLLGRPGVGKTTMLRETARVLADDLLKRVIVVDTSNEIAGDGDIPHPAIGRARRMQVATPTAQHGVMIEAVENHMPEVIVIDEIGTELEATAARTIAERGVQLVGTAHGITLENLMMNPTLSDLIGGIQSVTLSDEEARRRGTQKSILERKAPPTFGIMVEIVSRDEVAIHRDVAATVDAILRQAPVRAETRRREKDGKVTIRSGEENRRDPSISNKVPRGSGHGGHGHQAHAADDHRSQHIVDIRSRQLAGNGLPLHEAPAMESPEDRHDAEHDHGAMAALLPRGRGTTDKPLRIYPFGVSRNRLETAITQLRIPAIIVRDLREADMVMTLKNYFRSRPQPLREAESKGTSVFVLRSNTQIQMEHVLTTLFPNAQKRDQVRSVPVAKLEADSGERMVTNAMLEAEEAITAVIEGSPAISLHPQGSYIRRMQHELADRYNLGSRSRGKDPNRRVEIYRQGIQ